MNINKITNYPNNYVISPKNLVFKGEYEDRVQRMRSSYNTVSWWWSGEDEAREIVAKNMREEVNNLEKEVARKQIERDSLQTSLQDLQTHNSAILSSMESELSTLNRQKSSNRSAIKGLESTLSSLGSTIYSLKRSNSEYQTILENQYSTISDLENKTKEIYENQQKQETKAKQEINRRLKNLKEKQEADIAELSNGIESSIKQSNKMKREINCPTLNGFGSIAGYRKEKELIKKFLGQAIVFEKYGKNADVPNGVLLFGPDKNFNNTFAIAIANQYNCEFVEVTNSGDDAERIKKLRDIVNKAKTLYDNSKKRTLIFISDFDEFAPKNSRIVGPLKSLMDSVSVNSHATIIATTTKPEQLDDILLRNSRFQVKMPLPPADNKNIIEMIKIHLKPEILANLDISAFAKKITDLQSDGGYSIKAITSLIQNLIPDLDKKAIGLFEKQVDFMKKI